MRPANRGPVRGVDAGKPGNSRTLAAVGIPEVEPMILLRSVLSGAAVVVSLGLLPACTPNAPAASGPRGSMRAVPPPDVISPGNPGTGNRERVFDDNRGAPL